ncbi:MAG TPA: hypothetical protein VFA50_11650 [Stellaceae bacterium]|nr:hypothetical protein [Stellaceae bacterium]
MASPIRCGEKAAPGRLSRGCRSASDAPRSAAARNPYHLVPS